MPVLHSVMLLSMMLTPAADELMPKLPQSVMVFPVMVGVPPLTVMPLPAVSWMLQPVMVGLPPLITRVPAVDPQLLSWQ